MVFINLKKKKYIVHGRVGIGIQCNCTIQLLFSFLKKRKNKKSQLLFNYFYHLKLKVTLSNFHSQPFFFFFCPFLTVHCYYGVFGRIV